MNFSVELCREEDLRWIAEVAEVPGALAYGPTRDEAIGKVESLLFRILADRLENGEMAPGWVRVSFAAE